MEQAQGASSQLRRGAIAQAVDSIHAQQHVASFPGDERFFRARPKNATSKQYQDLYEAALERMLADSDFMINAFNDRKNLILDGTSAVAVPFLRKTTQRVMYEFPTVFGLLSLPFKPPIKVQQDVVDFEGTPFIPLSFEDWRVDPTVDVLEDSPFLYRYYLPMEKLKRITPYKNTADLRPYYRSLEDSQTGLKFAYNGIDYDWTVGKTEDNLGDSLVMVMERWGDFVIDGEFYPNHVLVWSNDHTFHYFGPNPYDHGKKPFIVSQYIPVPGTLYGKSAVKDAIPLAHALDTLLNQMVDILSMSANPVYTYLQNDTALSEYLGEGKLVLAPGDLIPVQSHESIRQLPIITNNLDSLVVMSQNLKEEIRESTGGVPYATGGTALSTTQRTLGEVQILAGGTSTRFQTLINFYEKTKLSPYLAICFENHRQFMTQPVYLPEFSQPITPNIVKQMDVEFSITGAKSLLSRNQEIGDLRTFLTEFLPLMFRLNLAVPKQDVLEVDVAGLMKRLAQLANIKDEAELLRVVASPGQVTQEASNPDLTAQALMAQQALSNLQGGLDEFSAIPTTQRGTTADGMGTA